MLLVIHIYIEIDYLSKKEIKIWSMFNGFLVG